MYFLFKIKPLPLSTSSLRITSIKPVATTRDQLFLINFVADATNRQSFFAAVDYTMRVVAELVEVSDIQGFVGLELLNSSV